MSKKILKGITWGHSRGLSPLQACSQWFNELNPDIEIQWKKRTLQEFADFPIEKLTESYDLLIIDHPWVGCAAATGCVLPLEEYLSKDYLDNQSQNQVGNSHASYHYGGHQWALAIDAAAPVPSYRNDLLKTHGVSIPKIWTDVLELAEKGKVAAPAIPIDLLMNFYMFCQTLGQIPFISKKEVVSKETGFKALSIMKEFYSLLDPLMFHANPIKVAEMMSGTDEFWYCPFAYGYSNYSREGYAKNRLSYGDLVHFDRHSKLRSTLGGTGIAVSAFSEHKEEAVKFVKTVVSENYQTGEYVLNGGQPGHKKAWLNPRNNRIANDYFINTLPSVDASYMRPRYNGYLHFQDHAGDHVREFLMGNASPAEVMFKINSLYQKSQSAHDE